MALPYNPHNKFRAFCEAPVADIRPEAETGIRPHERNQKFSLDLCKPLLTFRSYDTNSQFTGAEEDGRDPAARNLIVYFKIQERFYESMPKV
jgi:hypothetical protein